MIRNNETKIYFIKMEWKFLSFRIYKRSLHPPLVATVFRDGEKSLISFFSAFCYLFVSKFLVFRHRKMEITLEETIRTCQPEKYVCDIKELIIFSRII